MEDRGAWMSTAGGINVKFPRIVIEIGLGTMNVVRENGGWEMTNGAGEKSIAPFFGKDDAKPWMLVEAEKFIARMQRRMALENAKTDIASAQRGVGRKRVRKLVLENGKHRKGNRK